MTAATEGSAFATDDPVLAGALTEMASEGVDLHSSADPGTTDASQPLGTVSADSSAAPPLTGDSGTGSGTSADPAVPIVPAPDPASDPLAGTEPFTYDMGGQRMPVEGVYRVPGEGLLVPEASVGAVEQVFQRAARLESEMGALQTRHAETERLSSWKVPGPPDAKGNPTFTDVSGRDGVIAMRAAAEESGASYQALIDALDVPDLRGLLFQHPDGRVTFDESAMESMAIRVALARERASSRTTAAVGELSKPPAPKPVEWTAETVKPFAPKIIDQALAAGQMDKTLLTPADRATLAAQLYRYVAQGTNAVDTAFADLVRHTASARADAKKLAAASDSANRHNAGMERGRQPAKPAGKPAAPPPKTTPAPPVKSKADWDGPLAQAMQEMDIAR